MKIWQGYGSEHSANLVMIGRFKEVRDAEKVKELLDRLAEQVERESSDSGSGPGLDRNRYSDEMMEILRDERFYGVAAAELEQFGYEVKVEQNGKEVVITTEEIDVSGFLKALIERGARVEVYSAHDYPSAEHGR